MKLKKPAAEVWKSIVDFKNCSKYIESILKFEIIDEPKDTLIGFKWKETRKMFGKEATETIWITDFIANEYYQSRAESHGSIYISRLSLESLGENTKLTMSFSAEASTFFVKIISLCMGFMIRGSMKKALLKDLTDIKVHLDSN